MSSIDKFSRRGMLAQTAGLALAASEVASAASRDSRLEGWIDAHSHIWPPDTKHFPLQPGMTVEDLAPPSFTDEELMAVASPEGVDRVVLIQHNWFHGFDNSYLTDAWRRHPNRFRVVGMVDDLRPNAGKAMRQLLKRGVTGFRIVPRKGISDWLQTDGMKEMWRTAAETRQSMCCLINPVNLSEIADACQRSPTTPVVIDHFARIGIDGTIRESDLKNLCELAKYPEVCIKVSAYYALGKKMPPHDELIPMIKRLYEVFGPDRLMWASDCPYQLDGENTYAASISLIRDRIDFFTQEDRQKLLRDTAEKVFFFV